MKRVLLRPAARKDLQAEARYYRQHAGEAVARKLRDAVIEALRRLEHNPTIGSPLLGQALRIEGLRTWRVGVFPSSIWYFERADHVDVVRLVGDRQNPDGIGIDPTGFRSADA